MKSLVCALMAICFAISMAGLAHGRNVDLLVSIADAMAATAVSDRPSGAIKFLFVTQKSPEIDLEKYAQLAGANAVVNIVRYYRKKEMASTIEFECHVGNVVVTV